VLYSQSLISHAETAVYFSFEAIAYPAAQKSKYVITGELLDRVSCQSWIDTAKTLLIFEDHVGRVLPLLDAPIVGEIHTGFAPDERVDSPSQAIEKALPFTLTERVHQPLGGAKIFNPSEAVVTANILNPGSVHLSGQPGSAINANLNREWDPRLHSNMHQPKLTIDPVKVQVQTLSLTRHKHQLLCIPVFMNRERLARFKTGQNANQSLADAVPLHNLPRHVLFGNRRRGYVLKRPPVLGRYRLGVSFYPTRQPLDIESKLFMEYSLSRQENLQALYVTDRAQGPAKQNAVETCYSANDAAIVPLQKPLHNFLRLMGSSTKRIMQEVG
jgi:hypothetical protein